MVASERRDKPVQGGFLVLRPDLEVYGEFVRIIKKGIHKPGGWGGRIGPFYGFMTQQGLLPYYYDILHKMNEAIELNRCVYNQMMDDPRDNSEGDNPQQRCRTDQDECEDCRVRPLEDIVSAHFTFCPKPWVCFPNDPDAIRFGLCRRLHHRWFQIRSELEQSWGRESFGNGTFERDHSFGYCSGGGSDGYLQMEQPFGAPFSPMSNDGESSESESQDSSDVERDDRTATG